jgi:hypothetical protein
LRVAQAGREGRYQQQPKDENAYTARVRVPAQFMEFIPPSRDG